MKFLSLICVFILVAGCSIRKNSPIMLDPSLIPIDETGKGSNPPDTGSEDEEIPPGIKPEEISYKLINAKVLAKHCVGCHSEAGGNKGDLNLENYKNVFEVKAEIRAEVFNRTMPPKKFPKLKLNDTQVQFILDWIDFGAKEEAEVEPPAPPVTKPPTDEPPVVVVPPVVTEPPISEPPSATEPAKIYFAEVFEKVIQTNCLKCHSTAGGDKGDLNLETYQNIFDYKEDIASDVDSGQMPPRRGTALTSEQKTLILDWIKQGALEKAP